MVGTLESPLWLAARADSGVAFSPHRRSIERLMANVELPVALRDQGRTASGVPITDELIDRLAAKAEEGHDVEQMLLRREGQPPITAVSCIREPYSRISIPEATNAAWTPVAPVLAANLRVLVGSRVRSSGPRFAR
jgi:hypothetical protein